MHLKVPLRNTGSHIASSRLGFTLTELLVVIAVILILAGLLVAGAARAKAKARSVQCLNNVRQLGLGLSQFVSDNHVYPLMGNLGFSEGRNLVHHTTWMSALGREVFGEGKGNQWLQKGIWLCPAAQRPTDWPNNEGYRDYGYNGWGSGGTNGPLDIGGIGPDYRNWTPVPESAVVNPSEMLALGDAFQGDHGVIVDGHGLQRLTSVEEFLESTPRSQSRHRGNDNMFFCDGHATSVSLKLLFTDTADPALRMWNRDNQPHRELIGK